MLTKWPRSRVRRSRRPDRIHICGIPTGHGRGHELDVINFDAFGFLDHFLLYPKDIRAFLRGAATWPGDCAHPGFTGRETATDLAARLRAGFDRMVELGFDPEAVRRRSLITPACGLGTLSPKTPGRSWNWRSGVREALLA
jgi:hypothetical protein